jgi:hypothetical protein
MLQTPLSWPALPAAISAAEINLPLRSLIGLHGGQMRPMISLSRDTPVALGSGPRGEERLRIDLPVRTVGPPAVG